MYVRCWQNIDPVTCLLGGLPMLFHFVGRILTYQPIGTPLSTRWQTYQEKTLFLSGDVLFLISQAYEQVVHTDFLQGGLSNIKPSPRLEKSNLPSTELKTYRKHIQTCYKPKTISEKCNETKRKTAITRNYFVNTFIYQYLSPGRTSSAYVRKAFVVPAPIFNI